MKPRVNERNRLRVCVCTSYSATAEPRAPRHALAIAALDREIAVTFVECVPEGAPTENYNPFAGCANIERLTYHFAHRGAGRVRLIKDKLLRLGLRALFRCCGWLHPGALNTRFIGFEKFLNRIDADVYIGHNVETLLPVCRAAEKRGSLAMFDSMEFYSEMGDGQNALDRQLISGMESRYLPQCALVFASSDEMADALAATYRIKRPLALYNVPPIDPHVHSCEHDGLFLYWRNSVIGFGQRGLQDAFEALTQLPDDVMLHLQGRSPVDGGTEMRKRIKDLGLEKRVFIHDAYSPPDAVRTASQYCVGLCLEHSGIRNHELTVSNKMFDYLMGGLAVITSDLPSLRGVIERSHGGLCFEPGNSSDLATKISQLRDDRALRRRFSANARTFSLKTGNREAEIARLQEAFLRTLPAHPTGLALSSR